MKTDHDVCLQPPRAAYVHIPFCVSKCHYCDFSSFPGMESIFDSYVAALTQEILRAATRPADAKIELDSVYFGGGTPTVLSSGQLAGVLSAIERGFSLAPNAEVTVEANPGTVDESKLTQLREAGFNRLSLGVQSLDDEFLRTIGRAHTAAQALEAFASARGSGFDNVGIDLIFALPGQSVSHWNATLDAAIALQSEHVSLYELSIEEGTSFARMCARGALDLPSEDAQLEMYELAISRLTEAGYEHYEVSNFARPGFRSRHNQVYWRNEPYYGFGASATSYVDGHRARRICDPSGYIAAIVAGADAIEFSECLRGRALLGETVVQGLRMLDGIDMHKIRLETHTSIAEEFATEIAALRKRGLLEVMDERLKVTHEGLLLLNDVAREFVSCSS